MKTETYDNQITMLGVVKDKLLLSSLGQIFVVKDFTVENGIEVGLFGKKHEVKYITSIKIYTYNGEGKFLGVLRDGACESMLHRYDFYVMRQQWVDFNDQLKSFGFKIVKIEE
jgi:hypothetical protein